VLRLLSAAILDSGRKAFGMAALGVSCFNPTYSYFRFNSTHLLTSTPHSLHLMTIQVVVSRAFSADGFTKAGQGMDVGGGTQVDRQIAGDRPDGF